MGNLLSGLRTGIDYRNTATTVGVASVTELTGVGFPNGVGVAAGAMYSEFAGRVCCPTVSRRGGLAIILMTLFVEMTKPRRISDRVAGVRSLGPSA